MTISKRLAELGETARRTHHLDGTRMNRVTGEQIIAEWRDGWRWPDTGEVHEGAGEAPAHIDTAINTLEPKEGK